jgi:hypothetical protein
MLAVLAAAPWVSGPRAQAAAPRTLWEFTPYRVQLLLALDRDGALSASVGDDLARQLTERAEAVVGSPWEFQAQGAAAVLSHAMRWRLDTLTVDDLPPNALEADKVLLVRLRRLPGNYEVAVRELDVRTRQFGTVIRRQVAQPPLLCDAAFEAALAAFAPLAQIEAAEKKTAEIRLRAAALPPRDPAIKALTQGEVFRTVVRFNKADGTLRGVQALPWTYLSVQSREGATLACRVHSGLRSPLSGRRRGRVEQLAVAVHPPQQPTRLEMASITDPKFALAGYEVHVHRPDSPATQFLGHTDRNGALTVQPDDVHPLRLLIVMNGGEPLARLPVVPGVETTARALIPNDEPRLRVEGFITGLQERMVDVVCRRELLMALIKIRLKDGKISEAEALLKRLKALPDMGTFRLELTDFERLVSTNDQAMRRKIDLLLNDTRKVLEQHLSAGPIQELAGQVDTAKVAKR